MPVHPAYKMLSDDDINMQLAEGIYDQNDPSLFNAEQWAKRQYGAPQSPLSQPEQQSLQRNVEQYVPETNPVSGRNWYAPTPDTMPRQPAPGQQEADPERILQYMAQTNPAAKPLLEKARAKKQAPVRNEVFPNQYITGQVPPLPGVDKEQAFGLKDPFQMVKKSPSDMNEQEYKAYIAKMAELSRPDYVQERNEVFDGANIVGQVPPLPEQPRTDYYDGLPEWGGNEPEEPMISEQVGQPPEPSQIVEQDLPPEPEIDQRLANTTIGRMAMSAKDPRLLMAHLSQFAGELGNLRGKPTQSTALPFYQAQIGLEQQQRENAFKQQQLDQTKQKQAQASDPALAALRSVQADLARNKLKTEMELTDPTSPRSVALRQTMREYARKNGIAEFPETEDLTGADALKWISAMVSQVTMAGAMGRTQVVAQSAEERARIAAQAAAERAEADRKLKEQQGNLTREQQAQLQRERLQAQKEIQKLRGQQQLQTKQAIPGKAPSAPKAGALADDSIEVPGWTRVQNVSSKPEELKQFRARVAKVPRILQKIKEFQQLIKENGVYENTLGKTGQRMAGLSADIMLDLKGPEFKALGVLAGPDVGILEKLVPDTTKMSNQLVSRDGAIQNLTMLADNLDKDLISAGEVLGFTRQDAQQQAPKKTDQGRIIFGR
jgi:hypothetical protein